ncbi:MAG: hypothetical protein ACRCSL_04755 [Microbacterium sp.]
MANYNGQVILVQASPQGLEGVGASAAAVYAQRVYSSGLAAWCYFSGAVNQSPAPGDTTPNWTGSITAYELLARR